MNPKKSNQANLENRKGTSVIIGLIVSLSLILISFEWTSAPDNDAAPGFARDPGFEIDVIIPIPREETKPLMKQELPKVAEVLNLVDEDFEIDDVDFSSEVTKGISIDFSHIDKDDPEDVVDDIIYIIVKNMPEFNGGSPITEFPAYIAKNLVYPDIAIENRISGRVIVQFVVDRDGNVVRVEIVRGVDPALDREALRVVNSSPRWTPGSQNGKRVNVMYTFPINFVLQ